MIFAFSRDGGLPLVSKWVSRSIQNSAPRWRRLDDRCAGIPLRVDGADRVDRRDQHLHHRGELNVDLPVPVVHRADYPRLLCHRHHEWPKIGPSHWHYPIGLFAMLSVLCMALIIYIAVQPPNDKVLWITLVFLVITAIIWVSLREQAFPGSARGDMIKKRRAEPGGGKGRRRDRDANQRCVSRPRGVRASRGRKFDKGETRHARHAEVEGIPRHGVVACFPDKQGKLTGKLLPDHRVMDMPSFYGALVQALFSPTSRAGRIAVTAETASASARPADASGVRANPSSCRHPNRRFLKLCPVPRGAFCLCGCLGNPNVRLWHKADLTMNVAEVRF